MIRNFALAVCALGAAAVPSLAQGHPPHPPAQSHARTGHAPLDSAQHAALHAALAGIWSGTIRAAHGDTSAARATIVLDQHGAVALTLLSGVLTPQQAPARVEIASDTLRWVQDASGKRCSATGIIARGTPKAASTIIGKLACDRDRYTFALSKSPIDSTAVSHR